MKVLSWNVNGLRAAAGKGFLPLLASAPADLVFVQETKAEEGQLDQELREPPGWKSAFHSCSIKKGYSGVAVYWREGHAPDELSQGFGVPRFDEEGRAVGVRYGDTWFFGNYFPNGGQGPERVDYKLEFYDAFLKYMKSLRKQGKHVVVGGDYNTAHQEIDLARPKENEETSGFMQEERAWIDRYLDEGWVDTFRELHPSERDRYSWWSMRTRARERNIGWRIDYFMVDEGLRDRLKAAQIHEDVEGSDHAPITVELG
jgi:exodeoxyribonuclease-3